MRRAGDDPLRHDQLPRSRHRHPSGRVMEGLAATGIRGRVGEWVEGRARGDRRIQRSLGRRDRRARVRDRALSRRRRGAARGLAGAGRPLDQLRRGLARGQGARRRAWPRRLGPHEPARSATRNGTSPTTAAGRWSTWPTSACSARTSRSPTWPRSTRAELDLLVRIRRQRHPLRPRRVPGRLRPLADRALPGDAERAAST